MAHFPMAHLPKARLLRSPYTPRRGCSGRCNKQGTISPYPASFHFFCANRCKRNGGSRRPLEASPSFCRQEDSTSVQQSPHSASAVRGPATKKTDLIDGSLARDENPLCPTPRVTHERRPTLSISPRPQSRSTVITLRPNRPTATRPTSATHR